LIDPGSGLQEQKVNFPWHNKLTDEQLGVCHSLSPEELQEIAIHRSYLCTKMSELLVLVENLEIPLSEYHKPTTAYTELGQYYKHEIGSRTTMTTVVAYDKDSGQRTTARVSAHDGKQNLWLAKDSFPLEIKYTTDKENFLENVHINIGDRNLAEIDAEETALRAIESFVGILRAKPIEPQPQNRTASKTFSLVS
jgi:hypothetical protein